MAGGETEIPVSYETNDGRIFLAVSRPLRSLVLRVKGNVVTVTSKDRDVMVPIEVRRPGEKPFYGVVKDGVWRHAFRAAANVTVRNLATGETSAPTPAWQFWK